ncbi:hypothetical protein M3J09_001745 [Ascochyta lentis]
MACPHSSHPVPLHPQPLFPFLFPFPLPSRYTNASTCVAAECHLPASLSAAADSASYFSLSTHFLLYIFGPTRNVLCTSTRRS